MSLSYKKKVLLFLLSRVAFYDCYFSFQETFVSFFSFLFVKVTSVSVMRTVVVENITL